MKKEKWIFIGVVIVGLGLLAAAYLRPRKINGYTLEELKKKDAVMLKATYVNWGLENSADDYWTKDSYTVKYDGTIRVVVKYNLSGNVVDKTLDLSDEDYETLILLLDQRFKRNQFIETGESDGTEWFMKYYDPAGKLLKKFQTSPNDNKTLQQIWQLIEKYKPEN